MTTTRIVKLALATVATVIFIAGCATEEKKTPPLSEYRGSNDGSDVIEGRGGTVRVIQGTEIWDSGEPNRRYRVVGTVDLGGSTYHHPLFGNFGGISDADIVKAVKKYGGDAAIIVSESEKFGGLSSTGKVITSDKRKVAVVKYVP